jgi:hypothetical protein
LLISLRRLEVARHRLRRRAYLKTGWVDIDIPGISDNVSARLSVVPTFVVQ